MKRILITGANGQLGKELSKKYPQATALSREQLDISDINSIRAINWKEFDIVINAAAYVNADDSETPEGRLKTWLANAVGPSNLAKVAIENDKHIIHVSSEYVFDGSKKDHLEDEPLSPLSVYGETKAAADTLIGILPKHHILRTTWVIGDGHNFVKTMKNLADMRIDPKVVKDQYGRLSFASEIVRAIDHLISKDVAYGTYNISNSGKIRSWAEIASLTFELSGHDANRVTFISTEEYSMGKQPFAPRPTHSDLNMDKLRATGFIPRDYEPMMNAYIATLD